MIKVVVQYVHNQSALGRGCENIYRIFQKFSDFFKFCKNRVKGYQEYLNQYIDDLRKEIDNSGVHNNISDF